MEGETLYTVKEVSKIFKTNPAYVYELIKAGHLKCLKLGSYKIRKSEVDRFIRDSEGYDLTDPMKVIPLRKESAVS